jgi:hypothetical protein
MRTKANKDSLVAALVRMRFGFYPLFALERYVIEITGAYIPKLF